MRKNNKKAQMKKRALATFVMQTVGLLACIIGAIFLIGAAGRADYLAEIGSSSNAWMVELIKSGILLTVGILLIMFPAKVFRMSMKIFTF